MQELAADAVVRADAARHFLHVGTDLLAEIGNFVDEGDLHREEGIARVLDELGRATRGEHHRRRIDEQRPIDLIHHFARAVIVGADDNAVGALEVGDGGAFAQELGIGGDGDVGLVVRLADNALDVVARSDGHRRLRYDHGEAFHGPSDLARRFVHVGEIRVAVAATRWCADCNEDGIGRRYGLGKLGREAELATPHVLGNKLGETRLIDRDAAFVEGLDLARVLVDAGHVVPEVGKAGSRYEPDIPRTDHHDIHEPHPIVELRSAIPPCRSRAVTNMSAHCRNCTTAFTAPRAGSSGGTPHAKSLD